MADDTSNRVNTASGNESSVEIASTDDDDWSSSVQSLPILNPERTEVLASSFNVLVPQEEVSDGNYISYKFFGSLSFDKDAEDCMGTGTLKMPYHPTLWSFWEPGFQTLTIQGGTYDSSTIFHGRTRGIKQDGQEIEIALQDDGWRLKQQYEGDIPAEGDNALGVFYRLVRLAGMTPRICVDTSRDYTVQGDNSETGLITGSATGGVLGTYSTGNSGTTSTTSSTTTNTSSTNAVCDVSLASTGNGGVHATAYMINGCGSAVGMDYDNDTVRHEWGPWVNQCPICGTSTLVVNGNESTGVMGIVCTKCTVDHSCVHGYGTTTSIGGVEYGNAASGSGTPTCKYPLTPCGNNPLGDGTSGTSGSEDEEKTYEEMIQDYVCEGNDLIFYTDFENQCILYDYTTLMSDIESQCFQLETWMMKYPSFSLDVNQFGFYNTVKINYNGGTVTEAYEDLVFVYGEITKTMDEPTLSQIEATKKAKSVLASLLRDFAMEIDLEVLHSGAILPGTFISVENPLTANREIYYISGINVTQEPSGPMMCSLTLLYAPKNPEVTDIPEIAGSEATIANNASIDAIGYEEAQYGNCQLWEANYNTSLWQNMVSYGCGDCWADSQFLYNKLSAIGVQVQVMAYPLGTSHHAWIQINTGSGWVDWDYAGYNSQHHGDYYGGTPRVLIPYGQGTIDVNTMRATGYGF